MKQVITIDGQVLHLFSKGSIKKIKNYLRKKYPEGTAIGKKINIKNERSGNEFIGEVTAFNEPKSGSVKKDGQSSKRKGKRESYYKINFKALR